MNLAHRRLASVPWALMVSQLHPIPDLMVKNKIQGQKTPKSSKKKKKKEKHRKLGMSFAVARRGEIGRCEETAMNNQGDEACSDGLVINRN